MRDYDNRYGVDFINKNLDFLRNIVPYIWHMARSLIIPNPGNARIEELKLVSRVGSSETATRCTAIQDEQLREVFLHELEQLLNQPDVDIWFADESGLQWKRAGSTTMCVKTKNNS